MKYYLALDLAMNNTGWAVYSTTGKLLRLDTFQNPKVVDNKMSDATHRAALMIEFGNRIIEELNNNIMAVIVERAYGVQYVKDAIAFGVVAGFCAYMKEVKKMNMIYIHPKDVKEFNNDMVEKKMNPKDKSAMVASIIESDNLIETGIRIKSEHEADAVCLFHCWKSVVKAS